MGPDEFATREELGHVVKLLFAKFQQQAETIAFLSELLISKGIITDQELVQMVQRLKSSQNFQRAKESLQSFRDFLTMHNIVERYRDLPPDEL